MQIPPQIVCILASSVLVVAIVGCSSTATSKPTPTLVPTPTPVPTPTLTLQPSSSQVERILGTVPLGMADSPVIFADYARSRTVTGLEDVGGFEDFVNLGPNERERLYEGVPLHDELRSFTARLNDLVGLDIIGFDLSIWSWQPGSYQQNFLLVRSSFDSEKVANNLLKLDYEQDEYGGEEYYRLYENFKVDLRNPLRQYGLPINRIAFVGDWLLAASATDTLKALIDARNEEASNLLGSIRHSALAEAVGEGLLGGAFMTNQWIVEDWNKLNRRPFLRLDKYLDGPNRWGLLSSYTLALFGYRVLENVEETIIALYYPDPSGAGRDAPELEKRWNSFNHHSSVWDSHTEVLATRSCAPFSTVTVSGAESSILVGSCPVIMNADRDLAVGGPDLWLGLFNNRELQFLVQDLTELKEQ